MRHHHNLKIPSCILLLILLILFSSACTSKQQLQTSSNPSEPTSTTGQSSLENINIFPTNETDNIYDLPNLLYVYSPALNDTNAGMSAVNLSHDFELKHATTYKLAIHKENGKISFSIKDINTSQYIIDLSDLPDENTELSLDLNPGNYRVIIQAKYFQGTYRLESQNTPN